MEIIYELAKATKQLDSALKDLRKCGTEYAEAERKYRIAKSKKILELREAGIQTTLIIDLVKGDENVSLLDFQRNVAETTYKACNEAINVKKLELRLLTIEFEKEYSNEK